jgi:Ca2+-binding EF-hand superfamily protein
MSASSLAASSTLSRSRVTLVAVTALATAYIGYRVYSIYAYEAEISSLPGTGVRRSNAVHRRRRRTTTSNSDPSSLFVDDQIENDGEGHIVARTLTDGETVVDDQEYSWTNLPASYQRNGQNIVQLLFRVSEDATRRNAYVHRGCLCNSCGIVPIRGIRYRCANCADYDLCENCESQGVHSKAHIFYKIKVPAPAFGPRHIQPVWYTGDPSAVESQLPKHISTKLSRETGFERPELDAYWEQWTYMANTEWRDDPDDIRLAMDRKTFERCLVPSGGYRLTAPNLIFDRMFAFYDTNKDNLIGFSEFLHGIAYRKKKDKWKKIFEGYDIDGDGYVDRRDFLRIFRSYYVLYRQMHRDMLEGMEDQQMGTNEAHRLVSSRQPLSSAFGQDGRFPRAPDLRTGEGKVRWANSDEEIIDGKSVMRENGTDTGNREDVFRQNIARLSRHRTSAEGSQRESGYWATLLNPPLTVEQIPILNDPDYRQTIESLMANVIESHPNLSPEELREAEAGGSGPETADGPSGGDVDAGDDADQKWPPDWISILDEDIEAVEGPGVSLADVPETSRADVISHAIHREKAQRQIYERWQRRQFYTDEEEGATAPADWKEEDDLLMRAGLTGESSKVAQKHHSRSSSKVRFAEDMDDFDTRSNPSTSSRSVPERWGGMEIPDAERDAGKEILFQVTQQAFNELLDPLFKESEDLAVEIAATKGERKKYRALWETPQFEEWALEREASEQAQARKQPPPTSASPRNVTSNPVWPTFEEVEIDHVRERTLGELLAATGYAIENEEVEAATPVAAGGDVDEASIDAESVKDDTSEGEADSAVLSPLQSIPQAPEPDSPIYRDPTLPQFRPTSSFPALPQLPTEADAPSFASLEPTSGSCTSPDEVSPTQAEAELGAEERDAPSEIEVDELASFSHDKDGLMRERAYRLWKCDKAEEEAEMRGGFGRLNCREFEERVRRIIRSGGEEAGSSRGNQMDYLGSWIEFCIP